MFASLISLNSKDESVTGVVTARPILRMPPFPGAKVGAFACPPNSAGADEGWKDELVDLIRHFQVGGTFWAKQPNLPSEYILVKDRAAIQACTSFWKKFPIVLWEDVASAIPPAGAIAVAGECDPWHMLEGAQALVANPDDDAVAIAAILGVPAYRPDPTLDAIGPAWTSKASLKRLFPEAFENPFTGAPMSVRETIELCGFWRRLIDSNRDLTGALGFAFWKQDNVAPLLWGGSEPVRFFQAVGSTPQGPVAVWRSRTAPDTLAAIERAGVSLVEVEDGFLRSNGLGADCVPPLSITVDRLGPYFDPSCQSELEAMLQDGSYDQPLLARAARLRAIIVAAGLGKYDAGTEVLDRPGGKRRHILVPGQVEDDRAVLSGGAGLTSNVELLQRVRAAEPEAYILYKPHPDVLAGHRKGAIAEHDCRRFADRIVDRESIGSLLGMVDAVHVNTSLTGFEALLRHKPVTTHGVPFYAGWGLTRDLGPVPARRTASRTLDELVAATLLLYPRYLDPVSGLPCPAEIVVDRLTNGTPGDPGLVVRLRRLQGRVSAGLRKLVG